MADGGFTETHWQALLALVDAVVPSIVVGESTTADASHILISKDEFDHLYQKVQLKMKHPPTIGEFQEYLAARAVDNPKFVQGIKHTIANLPPTPVKQLRLILSFMLTRLGSLISTGSFTPFTEQPTPVRESIIQSWQNAWLFIWPMIANNFFVMGKASWSKTDPLLLRLSGYDEYTESIKSKPPGPAVDYNFLEFNKPPLEGESIQADVVIVGSGCGGGVCAKVLAEAGHSVIVVDKGHYYPPSDLPMTLETMGCLYEAGGALATVDGSTLVSAGSCWGGGGTINWSASITTPDVVRLEWAHEHGLEFFAGEDYQDCIDRVCQAMGVSDAYVQHNHKNRVLAEGAQALNWKFRVVPQNTASSEHSCGSYCAFGCRTSTKQGPSVSWLPAAAKAGARFIEGFDVSQVLFDDQHEVKTATGIVGTWTPRRQNGASETAEHSPQQRRVYITAKKVILSSGALNTPLLLMRSGLKNPNIGKNLHLHPCGSMNAIFEEDVKSWEGEILTGLVYEFDNLDGKGHGPRLESSNMLPFIAALQIPWNNGLQFKMDALGFRHMNSFISLARDRDSGSVAPDTDGSLTIVYTPSKFDRECIKTGLIALAKLCYIQGATKLLPPVSNLSAFESSKPTSERTISDKEFDDWIRLLQRADLSSSALISGHQMSSCRMSKSKERGVVDEHGRVWETEGLYVADASVFPSASGVNPMITIMAISDHIARGVAATLA